jgi:hypothetical protein
MPLRIELLVVILDGCDVDGDILAGLRLEKDDLSAATGAAASRDALLERAHAGPYANP